MGAAAGFYLAQCGAKIVGIVDREGGVINKEGFTEDEVAKFMISRQGTKLNCANMIPYEQIMHEVWDINAEIFVPCAASRLVEKDHLERLIKGGLQVAQLCCLLLLNVLGLVTAKS